MSAGRVVKFGDTPPVCQPAICDRFPEIVNTLDACQLSIALLQFSLGWLNSFSTVFRLTVVEAHVNYLLSGGSSRKTGLTAKTFPPFCR